MAIDGNWNLTMNSPMGPRPVNATFAANGSELSGSFKGAQGEAPVSGTIEGNDLNFGATVNGPMGEMNLKFAGTFDGDSVSGTVQFGAFGSGTFTGTRV
jgi:hypothetical protein